MAVLDDMPGRISIPGGSEAHRPAEWEGEGFADGAVVGGVFIWRRSGSCGEKRTTDKQDERG